MIVELRRRKHVRDWKRRKREGVESAPLEISVLAELGREFPAFDPAIPLSCGFFIRITNNRLENAF